MEWNESEHPRDEEGKFTNKATKAEHQRLQEIGAEKKEDYLRQQIQELENKRNETIETAKTINAVKDKITGKYLKYLGNSIELVEKPVDFSNNYKENKNIKRMLREIGIDTNQRLEQDILTVGTEKRNAFNYDDFEKLENLKKELNYIEKMSRPITNIDDAVELINYKINTGYTSSNGGVYDNKNVYSRFDRERIENAIFKELENVDNIDFSNQSEATYFDVNVGDKNISFRIGSHFKSGTSGDADVHIDYRNYKTMEDFRNDLREINKILRNTKIKE